jgi:hypothetical protein
MKITEIPLWANILSIIVGLAIVVGMGKWKEIRKWMRGGIKTKSQD